MTQLASQPSAPRVISLDLDSPELAAAYDATSTRQFNHGKVLIASLRPKAGERALDVGCGTGRLGEYVANLVAPNGEVVGIDPLPLRIELAARKNPRFKAQVGRAEDLSAFADASFDLLYSNSVFHWVSDKPSALREAFRVLKPGGRIGVNSADAERAHQSAALVREAVIEEGLGKVAEASAFGTNHRVNASELARLLREAGFQNVEVTPHTFVDDVQDVDDLITWSSSSSFGNFLSDLDAEQRARVRRRLGRKLESRRTAAGIQLERYLVFAVGEKR
jgi:ubiquinone/menaquinone biosynthesis C-methylase UbiE